MNSYFLYKHTNQINGKVYIGITNDISRRWRNQGIEYKPHSSNTSRFWNAIQKYGWNNFKHEILISNLTAQEACKKEIEYIAKYDSTNRLKSGKPYNVDLSKIKKKDREKCSYFMGCIFKHQ